MRKTIFLILFSSLLLAVENNVIENNSDYHQLPIPSCIMQKDAHYYTSFQLLITEAKMRGLEYAINNSATNSDVNGTMEDIDFHFKFGGKLSLGYLFDYDRWDLRATGSIYYSSANNKAHQPVISESTASAPTAFDGQGLVPVWIHPSAYTHPINAGATGTAPYNNLRFSDAKAKWNLDFYNAELELGKFFKVGEKVVLRPAFGLKSIFTYQKFRVEYLNSKTYWPDSSDYVIPSNSDIHLQTNGSGVGPKVGIETRWFINPNFKLIFDATGSLLYTFFRTSRRESDNYTYNSSGTATFYQENFNARSSFTSLKPYAGINIGAGWEKCFERKNSFPWKCTFDCTYFLENYWKMNNMIKFNDDHTDGTYLSDNTDLQMQSIVIAFSFSF